MGNPHCGRFHKLIGGPFNKGFKPIRLIEFNFRIAIIFLNNLKIHRWCGLRGGFSSGDPDRRCAGRTDDGPVTWGCLAYLRPASAPSISFGVKMSSKVALTIPSPPTTKTYGSDSSP